MPSFCCTTAAVAGKVMSGVVVATMIRSTSSVGERRHFPAPCVPAAAARSEVSLALGRDMALRMPVRCWIHSSEVSTVLASSSLVMTRVGRVGADAADDGLLVGHADLASGSDTGAALGGGHRGSVEGGEAAHALGDLVHEPAAGHFVAEAERGLEADLVGAAMRS